MQKVDYSKISPELRKKLEELDKKRPENQQLQVLQDIAMMFQEVIMSSDDKQKDTDKVIKDFGAVLIDARENLQKIANKEDKEFPEFPDIAKPITEVLDKLIKAVESKEYSPKIDVKVPEIKVPKSTINIDAPDLKGIEKLLKTEVPKAFEEAISKIPQTEIPEYPDRWDEVLKWLEDIDTATRMKPLPGSMSINNTSSNPVPITGDITVDTTGLATSAAQTDGSQKTQIVDAGGEVATVTGGKLDVNATASLAGDAIPATGATTAVTVQIADGSGNQITSFGGGTQYSDGDANADPTGTVAMGTDGSNVFALHTDTAGDLQVDVLSMPTTAVTGTFWQATQPVSGTVTANLSATDNAVLDAIELDTTTIAGAVSGTEMQVDVLTSALPSGASTSAKQDTQITAEQAIQTATELIDDTVYTDGVGTVTKGLAILGQDGTNPQAIKTDANGELQVDVLTMPTTTVTATDLDVRNLVFATDKVDASGTTLGANSGVDVGDVTINNASGASAVNIQDGGNSITVDGSVTVSGTATVSATDLDIRNLAPATDTVAIGDGTSTATVRNLAANDALNVAITDGSGNQITSFGGGTQYTEGDTDASITGTALMMEGAANALVAAPGTAADGLLVNLGTNNDVTVTGTVAVTQSGTWDEVGINDSGNSITVDNPQLSVVGSGTEATAMRVTIATDSTGVLSVDDNGSSLTVDGTVTANLAAGTNNIGDVDVLTLPVAYNAGTTSATTVRTIEATAATSTLSNVAGSASSVTLIAANTARKKVVMYNDSTADCYVKYGSTASSTSFTWLMAAGSHIEETDYNGIITGIWGSASGSMRVTEVST